jgi:hypothetical protein
VLFPIVDRVTVALAEKQMAKQLETSVAATLDCGLPPPTVRRVHIGGFPFLTQIAFGKFKDISLAVDGLATPGPRISSLDADIKGIHVPIFSMLAGRDGQISIDEVRATVGMTYDDLNAFLASMPGKIQVNPEDGGRSVEISGTADLPVLGTQQVDGVTTFEVRDNKITLVPSHLTLSGTINLSIPIPLGQLLPSIPIPVGGLPFDLNVVSASTNASGLLLTATAEHIVPPSGKLPEQNCTPSAAQG